MTRPIASTIRVEKRIEDILKGFSESNTSFHTGWQVRGRRKWRSGFIWPGKKSLRQLFLSPVLEYLLGMA